MQNTFDMRDLEATAEFLLEQAHTSKSGKGALTVFGGRQHNLRQTIIAIREGEGLPEHPSPGEATLQILRGECVLRTQSERITMNAGSYAHIPDEVHAVDATQDVVLMLTTVVGNTG